MRKSLWCALGIPVFGVMSGSIVWAQSLFPPAANSLITVPQTTLYRLQPTTEPATPEDSPPTFQLDLRQQAAPPQAPLEAEVNRQGPAVTGLIVDARGLDFQPSVSMRLFDSTGNQVYTTPASNQELNTYFVASEGTAAYATSEAQARGLTRRIGSRPHMIRAVRVRGDDLIISDQDAWMLRQKNQVDQFLDNFAVVVIWSANQASLP